MPTPFSIGVSPPGRSLSIAGTLIFNNAEMVYSPIIERLADKALFLFDVSQAVSSPSVSVSIEHRNRSASSWTFAGGLDLTAVGTIGVSIEGLRELIRVTVFNDSGGWIRMTMLPLTWQR